MATSGGLGDMNGNVLLLLTNSCKELLFCLKSRPLVAVQTGEKTWREHSETEPESRSGGREHPDTQSRQSGWREHPVTSVRSRWGQVRAGQGRHSVTSVRSRWRQVAYYIAMTFIIFNIFSNILFFWHVDFHESGNDNLGYRTTEAIFRGDWHQFLWLFKSAHRGSAVLHAAVALCAAIVKPELANCSRNKSCRRGHPAPGLHWSRPSNQVLWLADKHQ